MSLSLTPVHSDDEDLNLALQLSILDAYPNYEKQYSEDDLDDLDQYYDYDDIQLSSPSHKQKHKKKEKKKKRSEEPQTILKPTPKPLPFTDIVQPVMDSPKPSIALEILFEVCSHLSQSTLRTCVRFVCRDWYNVSYQFIHRFGTWSPLSEDGNHRLLKQMKKKLDTLECWFNIDPNIPGSIKMLDQQLTQDRWEIFRESIMAPLKEESRSSKVVIPKNGCRNASNMSRDEGFPIPNSNRSCLLHRVPNLSIRGHNINLPGVLGSLSSQGGFRFLRTLFLDIHQGDSHVLLFSLVDESPSLVELRIRVPYTAKVRLINDDISDAIHPGVDVSLHPPYRPLWALPPPKSYDQRYKLRIFDIDNCQIRQSTLEKVLATCPQLRHFKVKNINKNAEREPIGVFSIYNIDHDRLFKHAKNVCPSLECFNLVQYRHQHSDRDHIQRIIKYFPNTEHLIISSNIYGYTYGPNSIISNITLPVFSKITVLEISPASASLPTILNDILCLTPNLLHCKAPGYSFKTTTLYLPSIPYRPPEQWNRPLYVYKNTEIWGYRVWRCRNLRTFNAKIVWESWPLDGSAFSFFIYISRHRLFRNLVELRLSLSYLYIGQLKEFPHVIKDRQEKIRESMRRLQPEDISKLEKRLIPERFDNYLIFLKELRMIEYISLSAIHIPGMVHFSDFEFLQKKSDNGVIMNVVYHDYYDQFYRDQDSRKYNTNEPEDEDIGAVTIWPRLQTFNIFYITEPRGYTSYAGIDSYVETIRPGIDFAIRQGS